MSTVTNPLSGLIEGLLQGHALAQQMHQQQQQDQAFKTNQALHDQQMSMQDIMNRQMLNESARPVSTAGTIENPAVSAPNPTSNIPGMPAGPDVPALPAYQRKADASRTVKYGGQQYELKTPEEQAQVALNKATLLKHANSTRVDLKPEQQARFGLSSPTMYIPDEHLSQYIATVTGAEPVETTAEQQAAGMPAHVPQRVLPALINQTGAITRNARTNDTKETTNAATNETRKGIADNAQTGANARNAATNETRQGVAAGNNATTIQAAGIRRDNPTPTPGQAAVNFRFEQRRQDKAQQDMNAVQGKEDEVHALRTQIGEQLKDPSLPEAQRTAKMAQLKTTAFQVQSYQTRKASIAGAQTPPKDIQDKIPEGQQATGPDGHTWRKQGGIVYFVK
jgi:hypothetical protein